MNESAPPPPAGERATNDVEMSGPRVARSGTPLAMPPARRTNRMQRTRCAAAAVASVVVAWSGAGCMLLPRKVVRPDRPPTAAEMAELWVEPRDIASRDLFHGVGGRELVPDPKARWDFVEKDTTGYSRGWDVRDPSGRVWSVKIGLEAQTEVVASRIVWAAGYHQPPTYYVRDWRLTGSAEEGPQYSGRFRPEMPGMKTAGVWSWRNNPFVGTREYKGLLVLMLVLNNWDMLDRNTALYELDPPRAGARRWFVVRDLGASLGKAKFFPQGTRNDLEGFEEQALLEGVKPDGYVDFVYPGRHKYLFDEVTAEDVRWICSILARLTPGQWKDAFRAAGYADDKVERYVRKLREKVEQGRALGGGR
jgi:hypothetical protein